METPPFHRNPAIWLTHISGQLCYDFVAHLIRLNAIFERHGFCEQARCQNWQRLLASLATAFVAIKDQDCFLEACLNKQADLLRGQTGPETCDDRHAYCVQSQH